MSQEVQESLGLTTPSGEVVNLFPDIDPIVNPEIRRMVTAYLASGVATMLKLLLSPTGGEQEVRDDGHVWFMRAALDQPGSAQHKRA